MGKYKYPDSFSGMTRPAVLVCSEGFPTDRLEEIANSITKGSVLFSNNESRQSMTKDEWVTWRYSAAWEVDLLAFWFGPGCRQELQVLELGIHIGRYILGSGVRVIVGVDRMCPLYGDLKDIINLVNLDLSVSWKFDLLTDMDLFVETIKSSMLSK